MIPYVRAVNYLSPSALLQLESNPIEFYLRRLGPTEFAPRNEQGFPAAVGIVFDAYVKRRLAERRNLKCPSLAYLLHEVRCERDRAIEMGQALLEGYEKSGALASLENENPGVLALTLEDFAPGTQVPLQAKLDAITMCGGEVTVHDWKVAGAGRPGTRSPTPGYRRLWDTEKGYREAHKRSEEPLEALNRDWATQLAIYGWLAGKPLEPTLASVDEVLVGRDGRVRVAQFRSVISKEFQIVLQARLVDAWARIKEERVVPPELAQLGPAELERRSCGGAIAI